MSAHRLPSEGVRSLEALLRERGLGAALPQQAQARRAVLPTGLEAFDRQLGGGLPRGAICELTGAHSSGRTGLLLAALARCTQMGELAAYVDATDCLDQRSAEQAGVELERLLWIRCDAAGCLRGRPSAHEQAWQAAGLVAACGAFGVVALDLGGLSERQLGRWQGRAWLRLKQSLEGSLTALVVLAGEHVAGSAAELVLELRRERTAWEGLLGEIGLGVEVLKSRARGAAGKGGAGAA